MVQFLNQALFWEKLADFPEITALFRETRTLFFPAMHLVFQNFLENGEFIWFWLK